jgi:hypothetical protein
MGLESIATTLRYLESSPIPDPSWLVYLRKEILIRQTHTGEAAQPICVDIYSLLLCSLLIYSYLGRYSNVTHPLHETLL